MIHSIRSNTQFHRYYFHYLINSNTQYSFNQKYLERIIAVLNQSKAEMVKPLVSHLCIYVTGQVDPSGIIARLKRVLSTKGIAFNFAYSIEKAFKLHIHLMLVMECKDLGDADNLLINIIKPAIQSRPCVMDCVLNKRQNKDSYFHDLSKTAEFYDAVQRYSYYAKTNDKDYVPAHFKKTFSSSHINNPKYYSMDGNTMFKTNLIKQKNNVQFIQDEALITRYNQLKLFRNSDTESKLCFSIDNLQNNKAIGFYGLSFEIEENQLHLSLDDLCIAHDYQKADWLDAVFADLFIQVQHIINKYQDDEPLQVYVHSQEEHLDVEDWLKPAVEMACQQLDKNHVIAN